MDGLVERVWKGDDCFGLALFLLVMVASVLDGVGDLVVAAVNS